MSQLSKLKAAFKACAGTYPWRDFEQLLRGLGYQLLPRGHSGGSRRRFVHQETRDIITVHEPHNGEMKPMMVKIQQQHLIERGMM